MRRAADDTIEAETAAPTPVSGDRNAARRRVRGRMARGGFTLLEILMATLIVVIGVVGIMAMQIVAIQANSTARDTTEAVNVAEAFAAVLQQDASRWTIGEEVSGTTYLSQVGTGWQVAYGGERVSVLGVPESDLVAKEAGRAKFCVGYRLEWGVQGEVVSGLVRVYWPKQGGENIFADCGPGGTGGGSLSVEDLDTRAPGANMVTFPLTVRRTHVD